MEATPPILRIKVAYLAIELMPAIHGLSWQIAWNEASGAKLRLRSTYYSVSL
jgi:hypothetical protein